MRKAASSSVREKPDVAVGRHCGKIIAPSAQYSAVQNSRAIGSRAIDRDGVLRTLPLSTISIAGLEVSEGRFEEPRQVADELRGVKGLAKAKRGTCFILSRGDEVLELYPAPAAEEKPLNLARTG